MLTYEIPNTARRIVTARGEVVVWLAAPDVLMTISRGYLSGDMADDVLRAFDELSAGLSTFHFFADTLPMVNYAPEYRVRFTEWARERLGRIHGIHVLFASHRVYLAVSIINLVIGGLIHPYRSAADFQRELELLGAAPREASALKRAAVR